MCWEHPEGAQILEYSIALDVDYRTILYQNFEYSIPINFFESVEASNSLDFCPIGNQYLVWANNPGSLLPEIIGLDGNPKYFGGVQRYEIHPSIYYLTDTQC